MVRNELSRRHREKWIADGTNICRIKKDIAAQDTT